MVCGEQTVVNYSLYLNDRFQNQEDNESVLLHSPFMARSLRPRCYRRAPSDFESAASTWPGIRDEIELTGCADTAMRSSCAWRDT